MQLRTIGLAIACTLFVGLCGCGDGAPSADEAAEMSETMETDMEQMQMSLPQNPSEETVPMTPTEAEGE